MDSQLVNKIKSLSKDKESFKKLKEIFDDLEGERDKYREQLGLLESAIRNDYDAITITTMNLDKPGPEIVYVNDGFTRLTGYEKEEVIGKTPRILQGPKTDRKVLDKLRERLEQGQAFFGHTVNYRKDGTEFVNQWDIHPLRDEEGNITHWVSFQHDITERKRAEESLVDTELEFNALREEAHKIVVEVDLEGNIYNANKAFRELVGYTIDELKRVKIWELFPEKYQQSLKKRFDEGSDPEDVFGGRVFKGIIKHKNGIPIQVAGRTKLLKLKDKTIIRTDVRNISLQKQVVDTLYKHIEDFNKIVQKATEFVYGLKLDEGTPVLDFVSDKFPELTGLSPEQVQKKKGFEEFIHTEDLEEAVNHYQAVMEGKSCTCEYRVKTASGDYVRVIDYARPERNAQNNKITRIRGVVTLKGKLSSVERS